MRIGSEGCEDWKKMTELRHSSSSMRHFSLIFNATQSFKDENKSIFDRFVLFHKAFRHSRFRTNGIYLGQNVSLEQQLMLLRHLAFGIGRTGLVFRP